MKNRLLKFIPFISCLVFVFFVSPVFAENAETIPIPPKRPDILNVSPAYVKQLTGRDYKPAAKDVNNIEPSSSGNAKIDNNVVKNISVEDLEKVLQPKLEDASVSSEDMSISLNVTKDVSEKNDAEDTLISFAVEPSQMQLDEVMKNFLSTRAIALFRDNQDLNLDIQAYAEMEQHKPNSDVRISLARALEVRKFLMQNGISPSRLKLSAMGQDSQTNNHNRIDLLFKSAL